MAVISSLKTSNSLRIFSMKTHSSSLKTLFQTFISSQIYRIPRAFTKAKSLLFHLLEEVSFLNIIEFPLKKIKNGEKPKKEPFFGSFRLHYNWCSSHVMPLAHESYPSSHIYYEASWNSVVPTECKDETTSFCRDEEPEELSRYLEWLEDKGESNEIDKLADMFIANCHEKFRLEKQESYRRFQEMLARSI